MIRSDWDRIAAHARGCKDSPFDCRICVRAMQSLGSMPLPALNVLLSEHPAPRLKISMAAHTVDTMIDRTNHSSKRAKRDVIAAMGILKAYEDMGGKL